MATKFQNAVNEDARAQKQASENLITRKSTSIRILTGILSELEPNLRESGVLVDTIQEKQVRNSRLLT